jgi:hypothetical protein
VVGSGPCRSSRTALEGAGSRNGGSCFVERIATNSAAALLHAPVPVDGGDGEGNGCGQRGSLRQRLELASLGVNGADRTRRLSVSTTINLDRPRTSVTPTARSIRLWRVQARPRSCLPRARIERPLPFVNYDLPGVMSPQMRPWPIVRRYGVGRRVGEVVVASNNNGRPPIGPPVLLPMPARKVTIDRLSRRDATEGRQNSSIANLKLISGQALASRHRGSNRRYRSAVELDDGARLRLRTAVLVSGGFTPTVHLFCQARGKLEMATMSIAGLRARELEVEDVCALSVPLDRRSSAQGRFRAPCPTRCANSDSKHTFSPTGMRIRISSPPGPKPGAEGPGLDRLSA